MIQIRKGTIEDMDQVHQLIYELGVFENAADEVETSAELYRKDGFGKTPLFECFVAETTDKKIVGTAFFYFGYSTWKGKMMYLDDLIITASYRSKGIGKLLFDRLVAYALEKEARQLRWHVLDWNEIAINFYKKIQADLDPEWITCKLSEAQMKEYAFI